MSKNKILLLFVFFYFLQIVISSAQITTANLDFENTFNNLPTNWRLIKRESFEITSDSNVVESGVFSAKVSSEADEKYGGVAVLLPQNIDGKTLTFSGFIKASGDNISYIAPYVSVLENVSYSSLDLTQSRNSGKWEKFEFSINLIPNKTQGIELGVFLKGKGIIWLDSFKITVDGSDSIKSIPYRKFLASSDTLYNHSSAIDKIELTKNKIENIKQLCLIWGFAKYYHPNVANGNFNFDYQLFRILKKVLVVDTIRERDDVMLKWLVSLGKFETSIPTNSTDSVKYMPDLNWIESNEISHDLKQYLLEIKSAKRLNEHYYFGFDPNINNPIFFNENAYENMKYPDPGYRILSLFRYWNTINYFFPYKKLIGNDWENTLIEFIPKFVEVKDQTEYFKIVLKLINEIKDSHAYTWDFDNTINKIFGSNIVPLIISNVEDKPVITGFYSHKNNTSQESELKSLFHKGDVILQVGNKNVATLIREISPYIPASNHASLMRDVYRNILRTDNQEIAIKYSRYGRVFNANVKTRDFTEVNIMEDPLEIDSTFQLLDNNIAYIRNSTLKSEDLGFIWHKLKGTKGLIIDNRNYPKFDHFWDFSNYLFSRETRFVKFTHNSFLNPGLHSFKQEYEAGRNCDSCYTGQVVVLVNEITQSSSEFQSMAYKSLPNSIIIGSTTAGADGDLSKIILPGNIVTFMSGIGVYYPNGMETQRIGIVPDIFIRPTIKGIINGKDEIIERAILYINK